jgi:hypothetical protein
MALKKKNYCTNKEWKWPVFLLNLSKYVISPGRDSEKKGGRLDSQGQENII